MRSSPRGFPISFPCWRGQGTAPAWDNNKSIKVVIDLDMRDTLVPLLGLNVRDIRDADLREIGCLVLWGLRIVLLDNLENPSHINLWMRGFVCEISFITGAEHYGRLSASYLTQHSIVYMRAEGIACFHLLAPFFNLCAEQWSHSNTIEDYLCITGIQRID